MTTEKMPDEIWAQFFHYDSGELLVDAYDRDFERGFKYHSDAKYTALLEENERMAAVIAKFASIKADDGDNFSNYAVEAIIRCEITAGELIAARKALESRGKK